MAPIHGNHILSPRIRPSRWILISPSFSTQMPSLRHSSTDNNNNDGAAAAAFRQPQFKFERLQKEYVNDIDQNNPDKMRNYFGYINGRDYDEDTNKDVYTIQFDKDDGPFCFVDPNLCRRSSIFFSDLVGTAFFRIHPQSAFTLIACMNQAIRPIRSFIYHSHTLS